MDAVAVVARVLLAGVFTVSGVAKLRDRDGTVRAVEAFGLPPALVRPVAGLLPFAEVAVALGLVAGTTARATAYGAIALLAAFTAGIAWNLAQGRRPDCGCFGQLHSAPLGPGTLARNAAFAGAAGIVAWGAGADAGGSVAGALGDLNATGAIFLVVSLLVVAIGLWKLRRRGLLAASPTLSAAELNRPVGLPPGARAPGFALTDTSGADHSLADLLGRGRAMLLVFFSPTCGPCVRLAPELARWQREFPGRLTVAVVSSGTPDVVRESADRSEIGEVLVDEAGAVAKLYKIRGTPGAVLIGADGVVASAYAAGEGAIGDLLLDAFGLTDVVAAHKAGAGESSRAHEGHDHAAEAEPPADTARRDPDSIDRSFVPVARAGVSIAEREGETVLLDGASGAVHLLNPTAAIVWQCLDGTGTIDEIVADISDVFERDAAEVTEAVLDVVRRFGRQGLLEGVGVAPSDPEPAPAQPGS